MNTVRIIRNRTKRDYEEKCPQLVDVGACFFSPAWVSPSLFIAFVKERDTYRGACAIPSFLSGCSYLSN